jgi:pyruvate dehydrogenase E1 component alpha subunit
MLLIRVLEEELQKLCDQGEAGDLHFNRGQEGVTVGVCAALRPTDYIVGHHRTIAHAVAKGVPLGLLVAEVLGRPSGVNGGRAGEMHINYPPVRFMFSWQLVGTCVPVAAGLAWAVKNYLKTDDIVVVFHGDAATSNAQWNEGMNIAAIQKVPLLLICENNGLAGNVRTPYYLPTKNVVERARGFGVPGNLVDGNKVDKVCEEVKLAADWVRTSSRPYLLECDTTRLGRHKQGQGDIRSKEEIAELAKRDPLLYEERRLGITGKVKDQLYGAARKAVMEAIAFAQKEIV